MKKHFFYAVIFLAGLFAFSNDMKAQMTPFQFNEHLSSITDSLYERGTAWGASFNEAYTSKDFASLVPLRLKLEKYIDSRIAELKKMKDVKNSKEFREATIAFLIFEKEMITLGFKPLEELKKDASEEEIKAKIDGLQVFSDKEQEELKKVGAKQEAYARANGFKIESEEQRKKRQGEED